MKYKMLLLATAMSAAASASQGADVELWRLDCGSISVKDMALFSDTFGYRNESRTLTDSCYLIRHDTTYMLWDTGLPAALLGAPQDANAPLAPTLAKTLVDQLGEIAVKPESISLVGISHNHFDHIGQAAHFAKAKMLIGKEDLEGLKAVQPAFGVDASLVEPWLAGGSEVEPVTGDKDVFGDGSVTMLSMPGHTAGSYALLVQLAEMGPVFLSGDVVHFEEQFANNGVPPFNDDRAETLASMQRLQQAAETLKATLVVQHDATDIAKLPAFPASAK
ncbi:MBL fold metallo-hydrolase [Mesorhizobium sp. NBSH29]|uniref:N-acyl homoserine lactonase family protein n=1 Tax=Mesorhizobium sp. NBSH29 TaxID=2654249 RepID=UPI0018967C19|nr:N-acyl homoserine lactonase family protein [Mesorhizobium sp. NBSH29]QPC88357.1 MBL fold metallo-hydrolase [Mesorhizobium sp. NBSH29]